MNLTRRKFFRGLAVAPVVAVVAARLPALPAGELYDPNSEWTRLKYFGEDMPTEYTGHTTIQTSLSQETWRALYKGVRLRHG